MANRKIKRNLYYYRWDRGYLPPSMESDRVTCSIRDFEYDTNLEDFARLRNAGVEVFACLPLLWKQEESLSPEALQPHVDGVYAGNPGQLDWARRTGRSVFGDVGLNVFNGETVKFFAEQGLSGVTLSYELDSDTDRLLQELSVGDDGSLPEIEVLRYGRVPAMVSEYCPLAGAEGIKGRSCGRCMENNPVYLKGGQGERYPVLLEDSGCTSVILSKNVLQRKNAAKGLMQLKKGMERVCIFDETPAFAARI